MVYSYRVWIGFLIHHEHAHILTQHQHTRSKPGLLGITQCSVIYPKNKAIQYQGNVKAKTIVYQLKVYRMAFCLLCLETDGTLRGDCVPLTITNLPEPYFLNHLFPRVFKTSLRRNQNNSGLIGCVETVLGETLNSKAKSTNDRGDFF